MARNTTVLNKTALWLQPLDFLTLRGTITLALPEYGPAHWGHWPASLAPLALWDVAPQVTRWEELGPGSRWPWFVYKAFQAQMYPAKSTQWLRKANSCAELHEWNFSTLGIMWEDQMPSTLQIRGNNKWNATREGTARTRGELWLSWGQVK